MEILFECKNLSKEYGYVKVLDNINLKIASGEKLGIVGDNGTGKSTLANIIWGSEEYSGEILWSRDNPKIGYMKQATEYIDRYDKLSGGEKTKKLLNEIIYENYDMMILDEPTNHLDYVGVEWLIKKVKSFKGTVVIISHDRYFLDQCVSRIVEIENMNIKSYDGSYTYYRNKKREEFNIKMHQFEEQEKRKEKINSQIEQLKNWSDKAHRDSTKKPLLTGNKFGGKEFYRAKAKKRDIQIKSRLKKLKKLQVEGIDRPKEEKNVFFTIDKADKIGSIVLRAEYISKSYGDKKVFNKSSFYIRHCEKVGFYGPNGSGKSTLIKAMLGEINIDGNLYFNNVRNVGYISQEIIGLDESKTMLELFEVVNYNELTEIRKQLDILGFSECDLKKKIGVLSLGERMKLKILLMIKEKCDVLILDEPTNHIDLHVREQLEEVLSVYNGTIILVTHDRYMMEKICDKLLIFKDKKISRYEAGLRNYLEKESNKKRNRASSEEKMILDNRIAAVLGMLSYSIPGSDEYDELDMKYKQLLEERDMYNLD